LLAGRGWRARAQYLSLSPLLIFSLVCHSLLGVKENI
jgi:hypothetical protein